MRPMVNCIIGHTPQFLFVQVLEVVNCELYS